MKKFRSRTFCLVLYEEDKTHKKAIEKIESSFDYALILHNQDKEEDGSLKKPHYHVVIRFDNPKWNTALAEELGIESNYIQEARSMKHALLYLIHFYDEDKFQYSEDEVKGSLKNKLLEYINNDKKSESDKIIEILHFIDDSYIEIDYMVFCKYIASIGYWDIFRRSSSIISRYIEEHNKEFTRYR